MKYSSITLAAVALVSVGFGIFCRVEPAKSQTHDATNRAPAVVERTEPESIDEVAALRAEVRALGAEVARLREQINSPVAAPKTAQGLAVDPQPTRGSVSREEQETERHALMTKVEDNFNRQPRDAKWASDTTAAIKDTLNAEEDLRSAGAQVDCRSQSCRVELEEASPGKLSKSLRHMMRQLGEPLPKMSVEYTDRGNGRTNIVVYMDRAADDPVADAKN